MLVFPVLLVLFVCHYYADYARQMTLTHYCCQSRRKSQPNALYVKVIVIMNGSQLNQRQRSAARARALNCVMKDNAFKRDVYRTHKWQSVFVRAYESVRSDWK